MHQTPRMTFDTFRTQVLTLKTSVYNKTLEYVKTFAKFNTTDSASAVRELVVLMFCSVYSGYMPVPIFF